WPRQALLVYLSRKNEECHVETPRPMLRDFPRRLRCRAEPGSPESARRERARVDGVVLPHTRLAEDARARRWRDGSRQRNGGARFCRNRSVGNFITRPATGAVRWGPRGC